MNKKRLYLVFVPDENIDESRSEYSDVIAWSYKNLSSQNVLSLNLEEIYYIQENSEIFDIINEENGSMLQVGEDDWIFSNEIKINIQKKLNVYKKKVLSERTQKIIQDLLLLLNISIRTNKNLYFVF